jgi:hypothetical protein
MECDYTSCVWNDSYKGCAKPKSRTCPRPILEQLKKQQTNADRIRAMSDEELARHLHCIGWDCHLCAEHIRLDNEPLLRDQRCDENCFEHCLEWLKQPAEVTDNG